MPKIVAVSEPFAFLIGLLSRTANNFGESYETPYKLSAQLE